jgi:UDP-N-acetylglucosamine acyltransferase
VSAIHQTAIIDPSATLAPDVVVGPYSIVEGAVSIGAGTKVGPHCHLIGPMTIGCNNNIGSSVVLGDRPQHLSADGKGANVVIGDGNCFREFVTVNRGSAPGKVTTIGNENYLMANSHIGHDVTVGNNCILANSALVGGHAVIGDRVFLSGNSAVHQFCKIGRLSMVGGCSGATMDVPPFTIIQNINQVCGINVVGMKRAGYTTDQISAVRQAYRMIYIQGDMLSVGLDRVEAELGDIDAVAEYVSFIRSAGRGISTWSGRTGKRAA